MLILGQFCIIQNIQMSPIPQTSFLLWTFFAASYNKITLLYPLNSSPIFLQTQYIKWRNYSNFWSFEIVISVSFPWH